jgi:hypothetical protein
METFSFKEPLKHVALNTAGRKQKCWREGRRKCNERPGSGKEGSVAASAASNDEKSLAVKPNILSTVGIVDEHEC